MLGTWEKSGKAVHQYHPEDSGADALQQPGGEGEDNENKKKQDNKETADAIDKQNEINSKKEIARIITENKLRLTKTQDYFDAETNLRKNRSVYSNDKGFTLTTETGDRRAHV